MSVFDYLDYRLFLNDWIISQPNRGRGLKKHLAEVAGVQRPFVTRVLAQEMNFSAEHGMKVAKDLGLTSEETHFFILLLHFQRAGTHELQAFYHHQIEQIKNQHNLIQSRVNKQDSLSVEDKEKFYGNWLYLAIHLLISIDEFQTKEKLCQKLRRDPKAVGEALSFLERVGCIKQVAGLYQQSVIHFHLENNSPLLSMYHTNWRLHAVDAIKFDRGQDLHYSLGITISKKDRDAIRKMTLDYIERVNKLVPPSEPETLCGLCLDFYEI